jgi:hypothetical protein
MSGPAAADPASEFPASREFGRERKNLGLGFVGSMRLSAPVDRAQAIALRCTRETARSPSAKAVRILSDAVAAAPEYSAAPIGTPQASAGAVDAAGMSDPTTLPILHGDNAQPTCERSAGRRLQLNPLPVRVLRIAHRNIPPDCNVHALAKHYAYTSLAV